MHMHTHAHCVITVPSQFPAVTQVMGSEFRWKVLAASAFVILITFSQFSILALHFDLHFKNVVQCFQSLRVELTRSWIPGNMHSYASSLYAAPVLPFGLMMDLVNIRNMHIWCVPPPRWFGIILILSGEDTHGMLTQPMPTFTSIQLFLSFKSHNGHRIHN